MAAFLKEKNLIPEKIFSSSALRTCQTTELVNSILKLEDSKIKYFDSFYLTDPKTILKFLANLDNSLSQIMLVGHNPTMEMLIKILAGESHRFPTAAVAVIDLDIPIWSELIKNSNVGKLQHLWRPKELKDKTEIDH